MWNYHETVPVCDIVQHEFDHFCMPVLSGPVEGRLSVSVGRVLVFDGVDDQTTNLQVAADGGAVQGRRNLLLQHTFRVWDILEQGKFRQRQTKQQKHVLTNGADMSEKIC